jgi:predicted MPP superfamily phosphohydrolase
VRVRANHSDPPRRERSGSAQVVWMTQVALNAVLVLGILWLTSLGSRRAAFLLALVPLVFVPFSYARLRLHRFLETHLGIARVWLFTATGVLFDAVMVAQLLTARQPAPPWILQVTGVMWIGAVWFSAHELLLVGYAFAGLARLGSRPFRGWLKRIRSTPTPAGELVLGRRELLQKAGLFGAAVPFGVSLSSIAVSYDFRVEHREFVLPSWPEQLDGLRIVHLSDIHVGGAMNRQRLLQVAELTRRCDPQLVLHTGDFLTHRSGDFDAPLYEALARVQAPYGQWACLGNHDFDNPERLERRLRDCGVIVLRNRVVTLSLRGGPLEIAGVDFAFGRSGRAAAYERIVAGWGVRGAAPRILLNHDPTTFAKLPAGCADLVLSGHLHGGHIGVQLSSTQALTVVGLAGLPDQGLFSHGAMRLYVTRCVGFYGYPMRIGIPPEIALLVLRSPQVVGHPPTDGRRI